MIGSGCGARGHAGRGAWRLAALAATLVLVPALAAGCRSGRASAPSRHVVAIEQFVFTPDTLRVSVGDTVVWINHDVVPHTATASGGGWDSGELAKDGQWTYVPSAAGEWDYLCALHPTMKGRLIVE